MNKGDYLRLLEKVIEEGPSWIVAITGLVTAKTVASKQKKRKPKTSKRKR